MAHNDFFNTGNKGPLGKYEPLYPHDLGRPLKHEEQDYNAALAGQIINGYRVFGTGTQGAPSVTDLDKGLKFHEIQTTDADYQLYLAAGMEAGDYIWIPAAMGTSQSSPLSIISATVTDVNLCSQPLGGNGIIQLVGSGGTPAYSYRLESSGLGYDSGFVATATFNSLAAGTYIATIQDSLGNQNTYAGSLIVGTQSAHTYSVSSVDVGCYGDSDGQLLITPSGGVAPYTISVSGQSDQTASENEQRIFSGLAGGTYQVTVTGSNSCVVGPNNWLVSQPAQITSNIAYYPSSCNGIADNYVVFSSTAGGGGGAPYEYSVDNGVTYQSGASFPNIAVDALIEPKIRDSAGCEQGFASYQYVEPTVIAFTASVQQQVSCNGGNNGIILVSGLSGGQVAYTQWEASKDGGANWETITNNTSHGFSLLTAGDYDITVRRTDGNGNYSCAGPITTLTVTEPTAVTHDAPTSTADTSCSTGNGTITISNIAGGDGTYTASIQAGGAPITQAVTGNSVTFTGVEADTYNAGISDGNGCSSVAQQIVVANNSSAPVLQLTKTDPSCNGGSNGQVDWTLTGGTAPFDIFLTGDATGDTLGTSNTSGSFAVSAGNYSIGVTDSLGCQDTGSITVTEPTQLSTTITVTDETIQGANDGVIEVVVSGGTPPYLIVQIEEITTLVGQSSTNFTGPNSDTITFTGVAPGEYQIYTKDTNQCEIGYNTSTPIPNVTVAAGSAGVQIDSFTAPTILCANDQVQPNMVVSGGTAPYEFSVDNVNWSAPTTSPYQFPAVGAGTYTYYVRDAAAVVATSSPLTITAPSNLGATHTIVHETITTANDGEVTVTATGGTPPYSIELNGNTQTVNPATFTGLDAATYNYTVTDANSCTENGSATVNAGTAAVSIVSATPTVISCYGGTADVTVTASGGSGDYEFSNDGGSTWSPSQTSTTYDFLGLPAGSHTFTVKDTNTQDTDSITITISQPSQLTYTSTITHETVDGYDDGEIVIVLSGGTSTPNYDSVQIVHTVSGAGITIPPQNATNNGTTYTFTGLADGTYDVYGADANSCQLAASQLTVNQGVTALSAVFEFVDQVCPTDQHLYNITPSGGVSPYFWSADNGNTWSSSFTGVHTGFTSVVQPRNWKVKDSANPAAEVAYASNPQNFTAAPVMTLDSAVGTNGGAFDCSTSSITWTLTLSNVQGFSPSNTAPSIDIPTLNVTGQLFSDNGNGTWSYTTPAVTDLTAHNYTISEDPNGNTGATVCTAQLTGTLQATGYHTLSVTPTLVTEPACPGDDYQYSFAFSHAVGTYTGQYAYSYDNVSFYNNYTGATLNVPQSGTPTSTMYFREGDPGCSTVVSVNVASQNMTAATINVTSEDLTPTCYPSQGQFAFEIGGGISGGAASQFRYALSSDGGSTYGAAQTYSAQVTYSNLATGTYAVKAWRVSSTGETGEVNCNDIEFKTVTNPTQITWDTNVTTTNPTGCSSTDGEIEILTVAGGSGGYTFSTSGQNGTYNIYADTNPGVNGGIDYVLGNLDNGTYDVWIKDSNGCAYQIGSYTLSNPNAPTITGFTFDGCQECDLSAPNNLMFEHDATERTGIEVTITATSANSITYSDNQGSSPNTTGIFTYPNTPTSTQFTATFTATDDVTGCSTDYSYDSVAAGGRADMLLTDGGSVIVTDNGTGTSDIRIPTTGNFISQYSTQVQVHLLNYDVAGYASIGPGGSQNWQNNVVQSSPAIGGVGAGPTFTNVPNGNYMYVIVDQSNNCAAFNPAQIVANAASVNERTIYYFHAGGGPNTWPASNTGADLLTAAGYFIGSPGGDYNGGAGSFTLDISGTATLSNAMDYVVSFFDPNTGVANVPVIDGNDPGYEGSTTDYVISSYEMPVGQTILDDGNPSTRTTFNFAAYSGNPAYFYMLVPDNADFPEDLTSSNNYLYDLTFNAPTSAHSRAAVVLNGQPYWMYRLATSTTTGTFSIAFNN